MSKSKSGTKFYLAFTPGGTRMWSPSIHTLWRMNERLQVKVETEEAVSNLNKLEPKNNELEQGGEAQPPAGAKPK